MQLQDDQDLVVAYLHHVGAYKDTLTGDEMWAVYCEGDGFGRLSPESLAEINDGWDWSHVRDSSKEGWARMAGWLREHGYDINGPAKGMTP